MDSFLFIKTSSLGDVVHHCPAVSDAARLVRGAIIDWVVEEAFADVPRLAELLAEAHRCSVYTTTTEFDVKKAKAILLYVIPNVKVMETYTRDAAFEIFSEFDPLLAQREEAYASDVWNPMPNGLCAKYCGVKSCPHNGS